MDNEFFLRLLLAGIMGVAIGLDREYRAKEAGYRTHFLVSLGSALFMIISQHGFEAVTGHQGIGLDPSRVASQVVTGIGFIGAGTIILQKRTVRGLTTAAGIWATSAIGLAIGAGMYWLGIVATILTLAGLELLGVVFSKVGMRNFLIEYISENRDVLNTIPEKLKSRGCVIVSYRMSEQLCGGNVHYKVSVVVKAKKSVNENDLLMQLGAFKDVAISCIE